MSQRRNQPAAGASKRSTVPPPGRCVVVAGKVYAIDVKGGERRALAALKTHGIQATVVLVDGNPTSERLTTPDLTNPPPRLLGLIGSRFGEREVVAIKRGPTTKDAPAGFWVAVLRCPAGHLVTKVPGVLTTIGGCGACRNEEFNRARLAAKA
jgi:hypothetical protein